MELVPIPSKNKHPLLDDILRFKKSKGILAFILVFIGLIGLVIPVIPGLLFFLLAVALFKPGLMAKIRQKLKKIIK